LIECQQPLVSLVDVGFFEGEERRDRSEDAVPMRWTATTHVMPPKVSHSAGSTP
jgi:hypothetical protein